MPPYSAGTDNANSPEFFRVRTCVWGRSRSASRARHVYTAAVEQAAFAQDRHHALAEPEELLEVRIAGENELVDPDLRILGDPVGDVGVAAHECGAGTTTDEADSRPEVRCDLEGARVVPGAVGAIGFVQREHPALTLGLAATQACLRRADRLIVERIDEFVRL